MSFQTILKLVLRYPGLISYLPRFALKPIPNLFGNLVRWVPVPRERLGAGGRCLPPKHHPRPTRYIRPYAWATITAVSLMAEFALQAVRAVSAFSQVWRIFFSKTWMKAQNIKKVRLGQGSKRFHGETNASSTRYDIKIEFDPVWVYLSTLNWDSNSIKQHNSFFCVYFLKKM